MTGIDIPHVLGFLVLLPLVAFIVGPGLFMVVLSLPDLFD